MSRLLCLALFSFFISFNQKPAMGQVPSTGLKMGDRIVFLGDSITQAGAGPMGYVTLVRNALEKDKKELNIVVIGAGISGNKVLDLAGRLDQDVIDKKPTIVVIYIGINDVWHGENDSTKGTTLKQFEEGLNKLIKRIQKSGARVILATPSVIGEKHDGSNKLDAKLDQYANITRKVAKEHKTGLCDLRKAFVDYLKTANTDNKEAGILTPDRVHLNDAGNQFVAGEMLKALGK